MDNAFASNVLSSMVWGCLVGLFVGMIPIVVGGMKGRLGLGIGGFFACAASGAALGLLLAGPICGLFVWLIVRKQTSGVSGMPSTLVRCPHCAEQILLEARVCKHCGRDVSR